MRRSVTDVIAAVAGGNEFSSTLIPEGDPAKVFVLHDVDLSEQFVGFPAAWQVAVLSPSQDTSPTGARVTHAAAELVARQRGCPLLLVSDDPNYPLAATIEDVAQQSFILNHFELPSNSAARQRVVQAPIVHAVRRAANGIPAAKIRYSPYLRHLSVPPGWRFFGRRRELERLANGAENAILVGGRRVGKTSLLRQLKARLERQGERVYLIDVLNLSTAADVATELLRVISPREAHRIVRRSEAMKTKVIDEALRELSQGHRTTLLIDELGNLIKHTSPDNTAFLAALRRHSQTGSLRFIVSAYNEVFLKQQQEFEGPLVNFGYTLRLHLFTESETKELVLRPIEYWRSLDERAKERILSIALTYVGTHPLFLQYFCAELFERVVSFEQGAKPESVAMQIVQGDHMAAFEPAVEEVFYTIGRPLIPYLFLRKCLDAERAGMPLRSAYIDDDWIAGVLRSLGFQADTMTRRNICEDLEMFGLTTPVDDIRRKQGIAAPIVYHYVKRHDEAIPKLLAKYQADIENRFEASGLARVDGPPNQRGRA